MGLTVNRQAPDAELEPRRDLGERRLGAFAAGQAVGNDADVVARIDLSIGEIKDVPEEQVEILRQRAKRNHRSLQGELRAIIDQAANTPRRSMTIEELAENGRRLGLKTPSESVRMIREDRDR